MSVPGSRRGKTERGMAVCATLSTKRTSNVAIQSVNFKSTSCSNQARTSRATVWYGCKDISVFIYVHICKCVFSCMCIVNNSQVYICVCLCMLACVTEGALWAMPTVKHKVFCQLRGDKHSTGNVAWLLL